MIFFSILNLTIERSLGEVIIERRFYLRFRFPPRRDILTFSLDSMAATPLIFCLCYASFLQRSLRWSFRPRLWWKTLNCRSPAALVFIHSSGSVSVWKFNRFLCDYFGYRLTDILFHWVLSPIFFLLEHKNRTKFWVKFPLQSFLNILKH